MAKLRNITEREPRHDRILYGVSAAVIEGLAGAEERNLDELTDDELPVTGCYWCQSVWVHWIAPPRNFVPEPVFECFQGHVTQVPHGPHGPYSVRRGRR